VGAQTVFERGGKELRVKGKGWLLLAVLALVGPAAALGTETEFWQVGTFDEFLRGNLQGVSLSEEGALELAPPAQALFDPQETLALSLAADKAGNTYIGTGHQGKVFRLDRQGNGKLLFQAPEPEILALADGADGAIYAASSPEGKIYRITADGKSTVFYDPKAKYIWSLVFDARGNLYAGTGDRGTIYEIDREGKGKVFFESHQTHIICLALDRDGNLLAGSDPDGLVFRISPQGKGFVLYKGNFPEIHALALDAQGGIYAAALGGSGGPASPVFLPQTPQPSTTGTVTTVTVVASAGTVPESSEAQGRQPAPPHQPPAQQHPSSSFNRPAPGLFPSSLAPKGRGALVHILPDNSVETLWSSDKESIFGLALEGRNIMFSTDGGGRIFRLSPSADGDRLTLITETREALATRLLLEGDNLYVATSNVAKLFRLGMAPGREGTYESRVEDTKLISHWGNLSWRAEVPAGCSLEFYSRSGNSERPDDTWSSWAGPYTNADGSQVASPAARYIQWRAAFKGPGKASPVLQDVTVAYLNQNLAPEIKMVNVSTAGERTGPGGMASASGTAAGGIPAGGVSVTFGGPNPAEPKKVPTAVNWQAEDPNGDRLVYALYLKAADEKEWHLVKDKIHDTSYTLDPSAVPDGEYVARLVASDEESNPPALARRSELVSAPFWVDNTPPRIEVTDQHVQGSSVEVRFRASSDLSPLRSAEVSIDAGDWQPVRPDDGIMDSRSESFSVKFDALKPGEHLVLLRAYDIAGNIGVGKAVVRTAASPSNR
jgi:WD40 repeat protein